MRSPENATVAFAMPGGETSSRSEGRAIDLALLERQTMGDRALEADVLKLFMQQATTVRDRMAAADAAERRKLAHGLKGSAGGVGALPLARCAAEIERNPDDPRPLRRLVRLVDEVRDFIAAISR